MTQRPSVGRIVHYVSHGTPFRPDGSQAFASRCRAAIVTDLPNEGETDENGQDLTDVLSLCVLNPTGFFFHNVVAHNEPEPGYSHIGGTWHWPERVE